MVDVENSIANRNSWLARAAVVFIWAPISFFIPLFRTKVAAVGGSLVVISLCWATIYGVTDFSGVSTSIPTIMLMFVSPSPHNWLFVLLVELKCCGFPSCL